MYLNDRRIEFENETWYQGRLLLTNRTRRWSKEERDRANRSEEKMLFARFSANDEGRSRILLWVFESAKECEQAVTNHNKQIKAKKEQLT